MKLLHLASEYPPGKIYGLGGFVHGLARAQAAQGDQVHVLTNSHGGEEDDVVLDGVHLHRIAFPNPPRPSDGHGEVLQWNHAVVARLCERREVFADVNVIVGHDWLTAIAAREAAELLGRPLVLTVHDEIVGKQAGVLDQRARFARDLEALAVHDANLVVANSAYIARQVTRHYGVSAERVVAIHGGVDPALHTVTSPEHVNDFRAALAAKDELLVAFVGRLDPEKGLGVLAEAIQIVSQSMPQIRFVIAGTGCREAALRASVGDRARLLGYVKGEARSFLYRAADVVVVPSVYEPFGLVALEAMLAGSAVVAAATGGLSEIVRGVDDGLLVPAGDPRALAAALVRLAQEPARRRAIARAGRARALRHFAWSAIAELTRAAYARVVGARPAICVAAPALPPPDSVSAVIVTRDAAVHAEAALRALLERTAAPLREIVVLDHGSTPAGAASLARLVAPLEARDRRVLLVTADRSLGADAALLLALHRTTGERLVVLSDEIEVPSDSSGWLDGLLWLLDDTGAASVSPTLVGRDSVSGGDELAEQRRLGCMTRACFLSRRSSVTQALLHGAGDLGVRLEAASAHGAHWAHPMRLVHAEGEARRDPPAPYQATPATRLPATLVLVAYDGLALTREALEAVFAHTRPPYELVLVDNGSRDGTRELFREAARRLGGAIPVQVLENLSNLGYPTAANQGARAARGQHVVFLNNDTRVDPGWLDALLDASKTDSRVGVVTAKILNLDGTVQSAGGILHHPDGSFSIPGQGADRHAHGVSEQRAVLNAGGPCLLVTRSLLETVAPDGQVFDEAYSPGYFEDSDLCLRARAARFTLLYEPRAEVFHHGKATAALVAREGSIDIWGRFEHNKLRFHERWAAQLIADEGNRSRPASVAAVGAGS